MAIWSSILRSPQICTAIVRSPALCNASKNALMQYRAMSGGHGPRMFTITPSRFQWHKFKDLFHFYVMVGAIPVLAIVFYTNVFIGPAQLTEIPEGYEPKHWEYHKHPISRFIARYIMNNPQQDYEKMLHFLHEEGEKAEMLALEKKIREKMAERQDYQSYYYRPAIGKYHRVAKEAADHIDSLRGDN
ncbi:NADH dehydrogenase [ubiquinone] 1 beta subcomplex subunit 5, mitochondrial [Toxorhynchites rutilus septentrionalis]|uniref:NADH dehydrogenase [ubiquinone] 1 beta subcomplex subunit 5, mitochondrial n=1 Tax=Toxorhynchites rutilus septentrionalis TaxID=329112 RepID=UPI002478FEFB|nr:NADH dehydrogenase [ubiquinone] 1 beta subcomplex subunit 5, mitochondrial [Toxorhynchites rutilus septentrionalis]